MMIDGVGFVQNEAREIGTCAIFLCEKNRKELVWQGKITDLKDDGPYQFDLIELHPDDFTTVAKGAGNT